MKQWHYDPVADLDQALIDRLQSLMYKPSLLVCGLRSVAAAVVRCWLRLYHRFTIVGRQNLPTDSSFVMIANHASHLDTLCLLAALPIRRLHRAFPAAAKDYFCVSALRTFLASVLVNVLPFQRHFAPWQSLSLCAQMLQDRGTILILFPEGTRSGAADPGEFKPGAALLALGRNIPVVPCHLAGTHSALPKGAWCPRPTFLRLTIGVPRFYEQLHPTKEAAQQISRELREAVMVLGKATPEACHDKSPIKSAIPLREIP
jgi:1-acyl-sn-glycerol-3-phosphate acyltransferase